MAARSSHACGGYELPQARYRQDSKRSPIHRKCPVCQNLSFRSPLGPLVVFMEGSALRVRRYAGEDPPLIRGVKWAERPSEGLRSSLLCCNSRARRSVCLCADCGG